MRNAPYKVRHEFTETIQKEINTLHRYGQDLVGIFVNAFIAVNAVRFRPSFKGQHAYRFTSDFILFHLQLNMINLGFAPVQRVAAGSTAAAAAAVVPADSAAVAPPVVGQPGRR